MRQLSMLLASLGLLALASPALADKSFAPLPAGDGAKTTLQIRQLDFSGGASGHIVVEVRNPARQVQKFQARGLYFVPDGNAQSAPQRVGAVGPFEVREGQGWQRKEELMVQPGETVRLKLHTFCLDSHRGSPGKGQGYKIARERLPKELMKQNEAAASRALKSKGGKIDAAQSEIQSDVWKNRNKKWIMLEGERVDEKGSGAAPQGVQLQRRRPIYQSVE
jgi:hypothetical protein